MDARKRVSVGVALPAVFLLFVGLRVLPDKQQPSIHDQSHPVPKKIYDPPIQVSPPRHLANIVKKKCLALHDTKLHQVTGPRVLGQIFVSDEYRFLFCYVPKVASSNMKRIFLVLLGIVTDTETDQISNEEVFANYRKIPLLTSYSKQDRLYRLRNYTKAMIVRDPFERLASGYRNKFEFGISIKDPQSLRIKQHVLDVLNKGAVNKTEEVTFTDFIRFFVKQSNAGKPLDHHFAAQTELCDPCSVGYDYIATYDNIDSDVPVILNAIGAGNSVHLPRREVFADFKVKSRDLLHKYYSPVPPTLLRQLQKHLSKDSRLFDFELPDVLLR